MGEMHDDFDALHEVSKAQRSRRYDENMAYLEEHNIEWKWIDMASDHILIDGHIDYYLAKTYWFDRSSKKHGYTMLSKLLKEKEGKK